MRGNAVRTYAGGLAALGWCSLQNLTTNRSHRLMPLSTARTPPRATTHGTKDALTHRGTVGRGHPLRLRAQTSLMWVRVQRSAPGTPRTPTVCVRVVSYAAPVQQKACP
jgi:hypothetical protein